MTGFVVSPSLQRSLPGLLEDRAIRHAGDAAYTFVDYDVDPAGFAETFTWDQMHRRSLVVAEQLSAVATPGDRVAILAPQGMDYIIGFLGALQAGLIAVPLSVPHFGVHDERVSSVLQDCSPAAILTVSAAVGEVSKYAMDGGGAAPEIIEVDALDLDSPTQFRAIDSAPTATAYLQYTSGSTRRPAGVMVTHQNVTTNIQQALWDYFEDPDALAPNGTTFVSWLPFFHDMGLILGVFAPLMAARPAVLTSPMGFLQRPARWIQMLADNSGAFTAAPNFAFELAVRRTKDEDMAGRDLSRVACIVSGSERIHAATIDRFTDRFVPFGLDERVIRPSYGLAEATLYVATPERGRAPEPVTFDYELLSNGQAKRCQTDVGAVDLITYGAPRTSVLRIVDPDTHVENPAGTIGEIWVLGDNVAPGYWQKHEETERTFGARLVDAAPGTPEGRWLRTGDLGVMSGGELFIIGRIKDLLIVDGRNHYPDDIEATIQEITGGRVAAISVPNDVTEQLVAIVELKKRGGTDELRSVKREVTSAVSSSHQVRVADLVIVPPGSIPITTSGKIRRSACLERYRQEEFDRLDVSA